MREGRGRVEGERGEEGGESFHPHVHLSPQSEESVVTCSDETRHNFQTGDYVTFSEVEVSA